MEFYQIIEYSFSIHSNDINLIKPYLKNNNNIVKIVSSTNTLVSIHLQFVHVSPVKSINMGIFNSSDLINASS